jgi:2-deoxy-D-gluconate 3-dehydrogenase
MIEEKRDRQHRYSLGAPAMAVEVNAALPSIRDLIDKAIVDRIPEGRWGQAEDIAGGCVFLASGDSDYLNGTVLNIDGGWMGR